MARDTQHVLASNENTAAFLFAPLAECGDITELRPEEKDAVIQRFFNRYILLSRALYSIKKVSNTFELKEVFLPILTNIPTQFPQQFTAWVADKEFAEIISTLDIIVGHQQDFFGNCKGTKHTETIITLQKILAINPKNPLKTSQPLTKTILYDSTSASFKAGFFDRSIGYLYNFINRYNVPGDSSDRADMVLEVLLDYYNSHQNISSKHFYLTFVRTIITLFYFDDALGVHHIKQFKCLGEKISDLNDDKNKEFTAAIKKTYEVVTLDRLNESESPESSWSKIISKILKNDTHAETVLLSKLKDDQLLNVHALNIHAEKTEEKKKSYRILGDIIFYSALLGMMAPWVALVFATKGLFGAALPWVLPKCIAIASAISVSCIAVIVKVEPTINRLVSRLINNIRWLLRKLLCLSESSRNIADAAENPMFDHPDTERNVGKISPTSSSSNLFQARNDRKVDPKLREFISQYLDPVDQDIEGGQVYAR